MLHEKEYCRTAGHGGGHEVCPAVATDHGGLTTSRSFRRARTNRRRKDRKGALMSRELDQLRDLAQSDTAAWCSQDPASVAAHYSPDGSLTINGGPPSVGRAAITEAARGFMTAFPDMQVLMDDLVTKDSCTEYHWTLIGTNTGPGGTGNRVRFPGFEEWTIGNDGLIAKSIGHFDGAEYERQLERGVD
jgi:hypothetical protein